MSTTPQPIGPATQKVLAMIDDSELEARYPNRTHFYSPVARCFMAIPS